MIPKGVATLLPEESRRRRRIESSLLSSFRRWGYQEVIPPIFEYLDVFSLGVGEARLDGAYKIVDRATGRIMLLRPDVTPQIARMAATLMQDRPRPLRLCYSANVFRHEEEHAGRERERFQVGGELVGPSDAEADAEMICLAIEILQRLGLENFKVTLGQMAYTRGLLSPFVSSPPFFRKILQAIAKKETSSLDQALRQQGVGGKKRCQILSLLDLFGGVEVFEQAAALTDHDFCRLGLQRLREVYGILKSAGYEDMILIDLGEVRGLDYYTGTIFEVVADGVGLELGGGGRYDHLLEKFGQPSASTGFALYIERIQRALEQAGADLPSPFAVDVMLVHSPAQRSEAMAFTRRLQGEDGIILRQCHEEIPPLPVLLEGAGRQQVRHLLLLPSEARAEGFQLIEVQSGRTQALQGNEILPCLQALFSG